MASKPTYGQAFYVNDSGVITHNAEASSLNLSGIKQSTTQVTDAANWDGANTATFVANSTNGTNSNVPANIAQVGWLVLKDSSGNNLYLPFWQ